MHRNAVPNSTWLAYGVATTVVDQDDTASSAAMLQLDEPLACSSVIFSRMEVESVPEAKLRVKPVRSSEGLAVNHVRWSTVQDCRHRTSGAEVGQARA